MGRFSDNRRIEELSLNAWPALQTYVHEGWLLRFANGYTKRSNSVCALYGTSSEELEAKIAYCEREYEERGLCPIFKIVPFGPSQSLDQQLEERGYSVVEPSSVRVLRDLDHVRAPMGLHMTVEQSLSEQWLALVAQLTELPTRHLDAARQLLSVPGRRRGYFTLYHEGLPVSCGLGVLESGYIGLYDIVTDRRVRNQGYAEMRIQHMLHWARENGAVSSYLLVVKQNLPAIRLYDKLGYEEIYTYHYRVRD